MRKTVYSVQEIWRVLARYEVDSTFRLFAFGCSSSAGSVRFSGEAGLAAEGAAGFAAGFFFFTMTPLRLFFAGAAVLGAAFAGAAGGVMTGGAELAVLARAATALKTFLRYGMHMGNVRRRTLGSL